MALIDIPHAEYEIFSKPPLKAMLGQVRFPPVLRIADLAALSAFQDQIRDRWPSFAQEQQLSIVIGPGVGGAGGQEQVFRFTSKDGAWSIVLAPDQMTLEATSGGAYSSYEAFKDRFQEVWAALSDSFGPSAITRQGLRYVDHLEGDLSASDWGKLINPDLLGPFAGPLGADLEQAVSEARWRMGSDVLVFKHGIVRAGLERTKGYLLDFDFFSEEQIEPDVASLMKRFDGYHESLYALFRWCVTEEALKGFRDAS